MITQQTSVMIVENQPIMRMALSTALTSEGITVLAEVADSRDALQVASRLTPDLILFSVNDFDPKGYGRITVLRQELSDCIIVALVTGEFHGQEQAALDHGAHLVLTKSTPRSELLNAIQKIVNPRFYPATMQVHV